MAMFVVRVELHGATGQDYGQLHEAMERAGFKRTIRSADGSLYHLPTAEYFAKTTDHGRVVRQIASQAANLTGKANAVLVTEMRCGWWVGLS